MRFQPVLFHINTWALGPSAMLAGTVFSDSHQKKVFLGEGGSEKVVYFFSLIPWQKEFNSNLPEAKKFCFDFCT